jgi:hypothetical protein
MFSIRMIPLRLIPRTTDNSLIKPHVLMSPCKTVNYERKYGNWWNGHRQLKVSNGYVNEIFCWTTNRASVWRWLSSRLLRRVVWYVSEVLAASIITVQQPRRQPSSYSPPWNLYLTSVISLKPQIKLLLTSWNKLVYEWLARCSS